MKPLIYRTGLALALLAAQAHGYDLRLANEPSARPTSSFFAKHESPTATQFWRAKLLSAGILTDTEQKIRVGVPLISANATGPKLMLTFMPKASEGVRTNRVMCILSKKFD